MTDPRSQPCPNCARPCGVEYVEVETGKCQLWRWFNECGSHHKIPPRTVSDCFAHTSRRIRELAAAIAELDASKRAAQSALRRRHAAINAQPRDVEPQGDMFPDGARIESA